MSFDYVYYTALVDNLDQEEDDNYDHEPTLVFNEVRDVPIIKNTQDYLFAVESFKLDTKTLPKFIPTILYDGGALDTIYTIRVEVETVIGGVTRILGHTERIIFDPQDKTISQPQLINGYANYSTGYYNIYNYEWFIVMVNDAIKLCINGLKADLITLAALLGTISPAIVLSDFCPYFSFDKGSNLISFYAPRDDFESKLTIGLNKPLYRLFNSLPFNIQKLETISIISGAVQNENIELFRLNLTGFNLSNLNKLYTAPLLDNTNYESDTVAIDYLEVVQDYSTFLSWSPVESIVIQSSTIPIFASYVSSNHTFVNGIETVESTQKNNIDFALVDFKTDNFESSINYDPNEKRYLSLTNQDELKFINLAVFYRNKLNGLLIPLKLNSGGSFSIKLKFKRIINE